MMIDQHVRTFAQNVAANTFIGGIAKQGGTGVNAPIDTPSKLATKLGINASRITGFKVIGDDVNCQVSGFYNTTIFGSGTVLNSNVNINSFITWGDLSALSTWGFANTNITSYKNNSSLISNANLQRVFENTTQLTQWKWLNFRGVLLNYNFKNSGVAGVSDDLTIYCIGIQNNNFETCRFKKIYLPECTYIGTQANATLGQNFYNCQFLELISIKKCKIIYGTSFQNFYNIKRGCKIEVNIALLTYNNGEAAGDLIYAKNSRGAIVEFYDDNGNYISTL